VTTRSDLHRRNGHRFSSSSLSSNDEKNTRYRTMVQQTIQSTRALIQFIAVRSRRAQISRRAAAARFDLNTYLLSLPRVPAVLHFSSDGIMGVMYPTCITRTELISRCRRQLRWAGWRRRILTPVAKCYSCPGSAACTTLRPRRLSFSSSPSAASSILAHPPRRQMLEVRLQIWSACEPFPRTERNTENHTNISDLMYATYCLIVYTCTDSHQR
jgi:hypothetical protein